MRIIYHILRQQEYIGTFEELEAAYQRCVSLCEDKVDVPLDRVRTVMDSGSPASTQLTVGKDVLGNPIHIQRIEL
jgi:hypothetical protein